MDFSEIIIHPIISSPFEENAYIVHLNKKSDCFVIDPGFEPDKIIDYAKNRGLKIVSVLITHGHADHIAGVNGVLDVWMDCELCIGRDDADKLTDSVKNLSSPFGFSISTSEADRLLDDGQEINVAGIPIQVRHVPGHSRGHVAFLIPSTPKFIVFSGDVLFRRSIGRSDFPDGNSILLIDSIRSQLFSLPNDTVVYPGHGESTTIGEERHGNPFLV